MLSLAHHFDEPVAFGGDVYRARVYGGVLDDGRWGGWIIFFPVTGVRPISTDRETTQSSLPDLAYWASGLTHTYLHGALERALALQPEAQLARELERLATLEASASQRAGTLEAAADLAKAGATLATVTRERTEERLLEAVAESAEADAEAHEAAARVSRQQAEAADRALRKRQPERPATKAAARKKR